MGWNSDVGTAVGWAAFSEQLGRIGVALTPSALETMARRHGLPFHGGRSRGREVALTRSDTDAWMRFLFGVSLDTWLSLRAKGGPMPRRVARRERASRSGTLEPPRPLYVVTRPTPEGEQPVRRATGALYASVTTTDVIARYVAEGTEGIGHALSWRYDQARIATESDLRPSPGGASERRATTLVGAFLRVRPRQKFAWVNVSGRWFNLDPATRTPVLLTAHHSRFSSLVSALQAELPAVIFVAWSRRREISPMTFESIHSDVEIEKFLGDDEKRPGET